jgi:HEAT repeat protein
MRELERREQDPLTEVIVVAQKDLKDNIIPSLEKILKIVETLGLASNEELLMENIVLEKGRLKLIAKHKPEEHDMINQIIQLVLHIRYCLAKFEKYSSINGVLIPTHFRCPLSLQLMLDPVMLASGQTFERSFIQKWLDNGLRICPITHQSIQHTDLVSNYTVKAMISTWCEENNLMFHQPISCDEFVNPFVMSPSQCRESAARSNVKPVNQAQVQKIEFSCGDVDGEEESFECTSHHQMQSSYFLDQRSSSTRSESNSSVISSIDVLVSKFDEKLGSPFCKDVGPSPSPDFSSTNSSNKAHDDLTTCSYVEKLVEGLKDPNPDTQATCAYELRLLSKNNTENRDLITKSGAIRPLIFLFHSKFTDVQENAVTALLNLSINNGNKALIAESGALQPLIYVLESGTPVAKGNAAATLFSLSTLEEYKVKIGSSGAIRALVQLLGTGTLRGRKDAAAALFNLSIHHENRARIVQAGAVRYLILLMDPSTGMVDKSVALLANLSTIHEGRVVIVQEGGIPLLVETLETGTQRGKENAASALLQLSINSTRFCNLVLQEGAVPPLIALSQFGTPRAKEKVHLQILLFILLFFVFWYNNVLCSHVFPSGFWL